MMQLVESRHTLEGEVSRWQSQVSDMQEEVDKARQEVALVQQALATTKEAYNVAQARLVDTEEERTRLKQLINQMQGSKVRAAEG